MPPEVSEAIKERTLEYSVGRSLSLEEFPRLRFKPHDPKWLELRRSCLGGTDVAAILGLNPWKTERNVWLEKQGLYESELTERMVHGANLERYIGRCYNLLTGRMVQPGKFARDPFCEFFGGTPDFTMTSALRGLECKAAGSWSAREFGSQADACPVHYVIQCLWYIGLFPDYEAWDLAVLLGLEEFRVYEIPRDDELIQMLRDRARTWWETYMLNPVPPPISDRPVDSDLLARLHPVDNGLEIEADAELEDLCALLLEARESKAGYERTQRGLENQIKDRMGDCSTLRSSLGYINWRAGKDGSRRFLVKLKGGNQDDE